MVFSAMERKCVMETERQEKAVDRQKRVQRLKKMIILSIVIGIIVPWVACFLLFLYIFDVSNDLQVANRQLYVLANTVQGTNQRLEELSSNLQSDRETWQTVIKDLEEKIARLEEQREAAAKQETVIAEPVKEAAHKVYLTFDDGPSIYTDEILDILKQYDVKATFFVLGKESEDSRNALKRIVAEGHALGMHSYDHQYEKIYASREAFAEDFEKIRDYLFQVTGVESHLYRFPGGSSNTITNVDIHVFTEYLQEQNTVYYDWNVSSGDAAKVSLSAETIYENAIKGIESRPVSVILFHDAASRRTTVDALPMIIEKILSMDNTEILPISMEDEPVQHVKSQD